MIRYATFLLLMALTLIGHAMIRVMGSATFDGRFHGSWTAVLLQEPAKPKSNKELAGELVRQLSTGIAEMTSLSRSVRNASAMQQELLQALGSHQLTDGYGDGPHRTASWLPERVLADEEMVLLDIIPLQEIERIEYVSLDKTIEEMERDEDEFERAHSNASSLTRKDLRRISQ